MLGTFGVRHFIIVSYFTALYQCSSNVTPIVAGIGDELQETLQERSWSV